jgi:hypothetical protein
MSLECSCNNPGDIRFIPVGGQKTGITGLLDIFEVWTANSITPGSLQEEDIITEIKKYNYVSTAAETMYAEAVRHEYAEFREKHGKKSTSS